MPKPILLLALTLIACGGPAFTSGDEPQGTLTVDDSSSSTSTVDSGGAGGATTTATTEAVASASTTGSGGVIRGCWPSPCDTTASASTATTGQGGATSSNVTTTTVNTATVNTVSTVSTVSTATSTTGNVEPEPPTPEEFFPLSTCPTERPLETLSCTQWSGGLTEDGQFNPALEVGVCELDVWLCVGDCFYVELTTWPSEPSENTLCFEFVRCIAGDPDSCETATFEGCPGLDQQIAEVCGG